MSGSIKSSIGTSVDLFAPGRERSQSNDSRYKYVYRDVPYYVWFDRNNEWCLSVYGITTARISKAADAVLLGKQKIDKARSIVKPIEVSLPPVRSHFSAVHRGKLEAVQRAVIALQPKFTTYELAQALSIGLTQASRVAHDLENRKFIQFISDHPGRTGQGRRGYFRITPKGHKWIAIPVVPVVRVMPQFERTVRQWREAVSAIGKNEFSAKELAQQVAIQKNVEMSESVRRRAQKIIERLKAFSYVVFARRETSSKTSFTNIFALTDKGKKWLRGEKIVENPRFDQRTPLHNGLIGAGLALGAGLLGIYLWGTKKKSLNEVLPGSYGPPPANAAKGIDVSHAQGLSIDWTQVANSGITFAFMKATEGTGFVDPTLVTNYNGAGTAGILRGFYHFFHPDLDATAQANYFLSKLPGKSELPAVLDLEWCGKTYPCAATSNQAVLDGVALWCDLIAEATNVAPIVYTGPGYFNPLLANGASLVEQKSSLWVAAYRKTPPRVGAWQQWAFWQYTDSGTVSGINGNVDLDYFNGTASDLNSVFGVAGLPSTVGVGQLPNNTIDQAEIRFPEIPNEANGVLTVIAEVANTPEKMTKGLSNRRLSRSGNKMWFDFGFDSSARTMWMKDTHFALDMLFIDSTFTIVGILKNVPPNNLQLRTVNTPSRYVLEVPGGWTDAYGVQVGQHVEYQFIGEIVAQ